MRAAAGVLLMTLFLTTVAKEVYRVPVEWETKVLNSTVGDHGYSDLLMVHGGKIKTKKMKLQKTMDYLVATITVGVPRKKSNKLSQKPYRVVLDTGSSTSWLLGLEARNHVLLKKGDKENKNHHFFGGDLSKTRKYPNFNSDFFTAYEDGAEYSGEWVSDTVTLGGVTSVGGFGVVCLGWGKGETCINRPALQAGTDLDGYMGLGLRVDEDIPKEIQNPFYHMMKGNMFPQQIFSVYFSPGGKQGEFLFGGIDKKRYVPPLKRVKLSSDVGDWEIDVPEIRMGSKRIFTGDLHAVIDSGSKKIFMPVGSMKVLFTALLTANKGLAESDFTWSKSGRKLAIDCDRLQALQLLPIDFVIGAAVPGLDREEYSPGVYGLDKEEYFPAVKVGKNVFCMFAFEESVYDDGTWSLGLPFMKKYYTVFDAENKEIGFATSKTTEWQKEEGGRRSKKSGERTASRTRR